MNKELRFHVARIILVIIYLLVASLLWKDANLSTVKALSYKNKLYLEELSKGIKLTDAYPMSDEEGAKSSGYIFRVINNTHENKSYKIVFENSLDDSYDILDNKYIRYQLIKNNEIVVESKTLPDDNVLYIDNIENENIYELKLWISYDASFDAMGKYFSSKIALI